MILMDFLGPHTQTESHKTRCWYILKGSRQNTKFCAESFGTYFDDPSRRSTTIPSLLGCSKRASQSSQPWVAQAVNALCWLLLREYMQPMIERLRANTFKDILWCPRAENTGDCGCASTGRQAADRADFGLVDHHVSSDLLKTSLYSLLTSYPDNVPRTLILVFARKGSTLSWNLFELLGKMKNLGICRLPSMGFASYLLWKK